MKRRILCDCWIRVYCLGPTRLGAIHCDSTGPKAIQDLDFQKRGSQKQPLVGTWPVLLSFEAVPLARGHGKTWQSLKQIVESSRFECMQKHP